MHDEVVAADVPDEPRRPVDVVGDLGGQAGQQLDGSVAADEPVVVVVRLEVVEVRVQDRERADPRSTRRRISSWMRMLPGRPVSGDRARISRARRSVPFTRASSSTGSNGLMM